MFHFGLDEIASKKDPRNKLKSVAAETKDILDTLDKEYVPAVSSFEFLHFIEVCKNMLLKQVQSYIYSNNEYYINFYLRKKWFMKRKGQIP